MTGRARVRGEAGQASVELVALLPLALVIGVTVFSFLAAASARELASQAAQAGAVALLQDREPRAAAREALPERLRSDAEISVEGRRVRVHVRPRLPLDVLEREFEATVTADAGPEPIS